MSAAIHALDNTYLPTCLLRRAFSLAVQGDMISSEGET